MDLTQTKRKGRKAPRGLRGEDVGKHPIGPSEARDKQLVRNDAAEERE